MIISVWDLPRDWPHCLCVRWVPGMRVRATSTEEPWGKKPNVSLFLSNLLISLPRAIRVIECAQTKSIARYSTCENELLMMRKSLWRQDGWGGGECFAAVAVPRRQVTRVLFKSQACRMRRADFRSFTSTRCGCGSISCWLRTWTSQSWLSRPKTSAVPS